MQESVDAMKKLKEDTYLFFKVGIVFMHMSAASLVWCYRFSGKSARLGWITSTLITFILFMSSVYIYWLIARVHGAFRYEEQKRMDTGGILETEAGGTFDPSDSQQVALQALQRYILIIGVV
jgi:hypothetical protein